MIITTHGREHKRNNSGGGFFEWIDNKFEKGTAIIMIVMSSCTNKTAE